MQKQGETVRHKTQDCCCPPVFCRRQKGGRGGSIIVLAVVTLVVLATLGIGLLRVAYGVRHDAIQFKNETTSMLAAEAGYEQALWWMSQQLDILSALQTAAAGTSGKFSFPNADCDYQIKLFSFVKNRPIYRVVSNGHSGVFNKRVDVKVVQAVSGWDMGQCRVPTGSSSTAEVYFKGGTNPEIIDMPLQINKLNDSPDERDIYITGSPGPRFLQDVAMGESRYVGSTDKYKDVISLFEGGIYFDAPPCKITNEAAIQTKVERFKSSTDPDYRFTPQTAAAITPPSGTVKLPATQLEFFVEGGVGKVRITNNCTVIGYRRDSDSKTYDFKITPYSGGTQFEKYYIYAYHLKSTSQTSIEARLTKEDRIYVSQSFGGITSEPGGQIFVEGNVVIGGHSPSSPDQVVKGTVTVVAARKKELDGTWTGGNIWIADSVRADGSHDADGMPTVDTNPNAIGLIAQGVIKVVDPGMSGYAPSYSEFGSDGGNNSYPGPVPPEYVSGSSGYIYAPVASPDASGVTYNRYLSSPTVVEAAMTIGGGGWGAENVARNYNYKEYGGRKQAGNSVQDNLIVRGTIVEAVRGVVGRVDKDGYVKNYYLDERLLQGILPGDIWLRGTYIPAPGGWQDYRAAN